jgi:signal transduction histidine kinase
MEDVVRVLVIDDSDDDRMLYRRALKKVFGDRLSVTEQPSGDSVLQVIEKSDPSCVLLDYSLPGQNGIEVLKLIRSKRPHLPVILMTGQGSEAVAVQSIKEGAQDYITKAEVTPDTLGRVIRLAIEKSALNKQVDEQHAAFEIFSRDLAEARDAAERANRAKSHFLAGMSHELRTPLNGILGYAELLHSGGNLDATQLMRVEAMRTAGKHLLQMITCVLDLSEMETGRTEVQLVECEVEPIAAACFDLIRPAAEAKSLSLAIAVSPDTPTCLITDPMRLRQVLFNLLGNAAKFTRQGEIGLRLRNVADGSMLRFEVTDTGPGILPDQRPRLFHDFERLDSATAHEGAGLGLAISARLATLMGGRIGHEDNPGGGSVFWLELPSQHVATVIPAPVPAGGVTGYRSKPMGSLKVLIVDDTPMNLEIARAFLIAGGHNVTCVESGSEAIVAVESTAFDVVLMDVRMPGMDGLEVTRRIRALSSERAKVPIVAFTAHALTEQVARCLEAGMDSHLAKPFSRDALLSAVAAAAPRWCTRPG